MVVIVVYFRHSHSRQLFVASVLVAVVRVRTNNIKFNNSYKKV